MRLLLDMDGVVADFMGEVYRQTEIETGRKYCHADTVDYWFNDSPDRALFLDIMNREGVYRHLDVITGAIQAVNRLREHYDVVVCSAPPKTSKTAEDEKRGWLAEHFDTDFAEQAIITRNKHLVMGRVIIEDNPFIDRDANWQPIIFDQAWNQDVTDLPRMKGWHDLAPVYRSME